VKNDLRRQKSTEKFQEYIVALREKSQISILLEE